MHRFANWITESLGAKHMLCKITKQHNFTEVFNLCGWKPLFDFMSKHKITNIH